MTSRLDARRPRGPGPGTAHGRRPECGGNDIDWNLARDTLRHDRVCRTCGYQGALVLETDVG